MKHLFLIILSVFAALWASAQERDDACVFDKFEYVATVHADNSWSVHETITANFLEKRHGIFQYIELPFMVNLEGENRELTTEVTDISVEGDMYKVSSEESGRYCVIRIGDADRTISGSHEYNINYTLHFFDDGCSGADLLYTSVLGAQWKNDIREFSFTIKFDKPLPAGFADSLMMFSGKLGSTANELGVKWEVDTLAGCITGQVSVVDHHNAITLKATLPEGYWDMTGVGSAPAPIPQADSFVGEQTYSGSGMNLPTKILLALTFLTFLAALVYTLTHRRRNPIVSVEYTAPEGLSSAEIGYIVDNTADVSDLSSLIVWWASKGYVTIEEEKPDGYLPGRLYGNDGASLDIILTVRKPLPDDAPEYQQTFWNVFFATSNKCSANNLGDKHTEIESALLALRKKFVGDQKLMQGNKTSLLLMMIFFLLAAATLICSATDGLKPIISFFIEWFFFCSMCGFVWLEIMEKGFSSYFSKTSKKRYAGPLVLITGIGLTCLEISNLETSLPTEAVMGIFICGWVLAFLMYHMKQNTPYRMEMLSRILGFKEFIRAAEMPMLKAMVDENPSYFYDVLPYAIAFGLSDKWCAQFEGINIEAPDWYTIGTVDSGVSNLSMTNGLMMAQSLTDTFDNVIAASIQSSSIDPSSSGSGGGFSGGGYSGGGGGGGGGGSW